MTWCGRISRIEIVLFVVHNAHMRKTDFDASIKKATSPELIKLNLLMGGLFLATYELLVLVLVDNPKSFFGEFERVKGEWKTVESQSYRDNVLKQEKDRYKASAKWFREMDAITEAEYQKILAIRHHRKQIAHELPKLLIDATLEVNIDLLINAKKLIHKMDEWWLRNIELSISADSGIDAETAEVQSGRMILVDHIFSCVFRDVLEDNASQAQENADKIEENASNP